MIDPTEFSIERANKIKRWERNRDHTSGVDAVKDAGEKYLLKHESQNDQDYQAYKDEVEYFPAAARTLESHLGLVFRKEPKLSAVDQIRNLTYSITDDGKSLEQVARFLMREYMVTNSGGILTDYTSTAAAPSLAAHELLDQRPYFAVYQAESIREIKYVTTNGRKTLTLVRLMDDCDHARKLELIDNVYTVTLYTRVEKQWIETANYQPKANGKNLTFIPFEHFADQDDEGAIFDDLCALNQTHYVTSARLTYGHVWCTSPKLFLAGVANDVTVDMRPEALVRSENENAKLDYVEISGAALKPIESKLDGIQDRMAQIGSRMLQSEKSAAEAAETVARRQASENSILAATARHVSEKITNSLEHLAFWLGITDDTLDFELNNDFIPNTIDPQLLAQLNAMNQSGQLPDQLYFDALQRGELISEAVSYDEWQGMRETQPIDQPITPASGNPIG